MMLVLKKLKSLTNSVHWGTILIFEIYHSSNQTYLSKDIHFGGPRRFFGELLSDYWSTSLNFEDYDAKFGPFYPLEDHLNVKNSIKSVLILSNQTHQTIYP